MGLKAVIVVPASSSIPVVGPTVLPAQSGILIAIVAGGGGPIKFPVVPAANQIIIVQDGDYSAGANPITVDGNGNMIDIPQLGPSSTYTIGDNGTDSWFNWKGSSWGVLA